MLIFIHFHIHAGDVIGILKEDSACKCSKCIYNISLKRERERERCMEYNYKYSPRVVNTVAEYKLNISIN